MSEPSGSGRAWTIAVLLTLFMLINFLDKIALGLVAVPMMDELRLTPKQFGDIGSGFFWLFAIGGVFGGFLADRFKARTLILGMVLLWSLCQVPIAWTASIGTIIVCRAVLGASQGPAWPVAVHALAKWFPDDRRNVPIAIVAQGSAAGLILAGLLMPAITATWGWRANFLVLAVIGCAWALIWLMVADEGTQDGGASGVSASNEVVLPYAQLLFDRSVLGCAITHFVGYWSLALTLTWLPAYFERGLGYDSIASGWLYSLVIAVMIPFGVGLAWGSERLLRSGVPSRTARGRYLSALLIAAGVFFAVVLVCPKADWLRVGLIALALGCTPIVYSLGPAVLAEVVPASQRGAMLAINNSVASLAGIAAPVVTGAFIQDVPGAQGYELGFALCGALMIAGGLFGFWLINPQRSVRYAT
jgi:MFS family permease